RMGGPALDDRHTSALRSWIESIPAPRAETPADPLAASRGKELFDGVAGCSSCHAGPRFTNNLTVDVGTGAPMQTPSLIGVSAHAPYMHNG
ncbi:cytochrome-c peroxidase, partial [Pseudomonas sp. GW460-C3]